MIIINKIIGSFVVMLFMVAVSYAGDIVIIAGDDFPKKSLTVSQLKDIYMGNVQMLEGTRIMPLDQKDSDPIKKEFLKNVLGMSLDEYKGYWIKKVFREGGVPPTTVKNAPGEVIAGVKEKKGSIGYVYKEEGKDGVKILLSITTP